MELIIITGLSGAGKTRAADICEDLNYYCVDNLPAELLPQFADLCRAARGRYEKTAVVMDVRSLTEPEKISGALDALSSLGVTVRILYLEASPGSILRRYKESRRPHPLAADGVSIQDALERESALLAPLRARADLIVDTTGLSLNRLRDRIRVILDAEEHSFALNVISFGFKIGAPAEADMVFDARCLPNPYYEDSLRDLTGLDAPVREYIFQDPAAAGFLEKLRDLMEYLIPLYKKDRAELTVAVGCTGGRHRSVAVAQALADALVQPSLTVNITHRDMER